jgi:hypothetical protein
MAALKFKRKVGPFWRNLEGSLPPGLDVGGNDRASFSPAHIRGGGSVAGGLPGAQETFP